MHNLDPDPFGIPPMPRLPDKQERIVDALVNIIWYGGIGLLTVLALLLLSQKGFKK